MDKTAVVVYSGGMDSTTLLYFLNSLGYKVVAVSFDYNQRHFRELESAKLICSKMKIPHHVVDLKSITPLMTNSALTNPTIPVPEGHYAEESMRTTIVPNRNAIMLSIAYGLAVNIDANTVACAVHAGDHYIYPDCRPEFITLLEASLKAGTERNITISTPFINNSKAQIARIGFPLNVPYALTWTCYKGGNVHCGKCGACVERQEAFQEAKISDPTIYGSN